MALIIINNNPIAKLKGIIIRITLITPAKENKSIIAKIVNVLMNVKIKLRVMFIIQKIKKVKFILVMQSVKS